MPDIVVGTNSYITLADAETYFSERVYSDAWSALLDPAKTLLLLSAAKYLDHGFVWVGDKTTIDQPLEWPRSGAELVPTAIIHAQCEIALLLAREGYDLNESEKNIKIGQVSVEFDNTGMFSTHILNTLSGYGVVKSQSDSVVSVSVIRT